MNAESERQPLHKFMNISQDRVSDCQIVLGIREMYRAPHLLHFEAELGEVFHDGAQGRGLVPRPPLMVGAVPPAP